MLKILGKVPLYVYFASLVGGVAMTYIFYPTSNQKRKSSKKNGKSFFIKKINNK